MNEASWYKDAVIYELHVRAFQDSDGDGIGDFRGLLDRLDYFSELGVTALWLLPFYPSPLRDDGYDIADYYSVNPSYGTIEDFQQLLTEAHRRGLKIITELVLNHTSDQNPWFTRARRAPAGSPERDFYVWSDDPKRYREARIIFKDFETSNWTWDSVAKSYFWHRFYSHQPDLNFDNPLVHDELLKVIDFWLEMGVDGVRLDAVPYLYERDGTNCENLPETHEFLRKLRRHVDTKFPNRMLLAEANQWPEDSAAYFGKGDECHMEFHFPLMPRMFMALQMEDRFPVIDILDQTPAIPEGCQWAIFLRNHDELTLEMVTDEERDYMYRVYAHDPRARINLGIRRRLAPLLENNRRKIELINSLLFSLPGTPIIYYGDEIGMGDNFYLGDRNGVRTPMQWNADRNAGFSRANPQQLYLPAIIDPEYHYESVNVETQQRNASSLFWWMRRLLHVRRQFTAFARGTLEFLHPENAKILAYVRRLDDQVILVVANLSRFVQVADLDLASFAGLTPVELFGQTVFPKVRETPMTFTVGPHGFYWLGLQRAAETQIKVASWTPHRLVLSPEWSPALAQELAEDVLPRYLPACAWFRSRGRQVREVEMAREVVLDAATGVRLLLLRATFVEGMPEMYQLPVALVEGEVATAVAAEAPQAVLAQIGDKLLVDALYVAWFRTWLLQFFFQRDQRRGTRIQWWATLATVAPLPDAAALALPSRVMSVDQANTTVAYGESWVIKFFRKYESGAHPDVELTRFLSLERHFPHTVPYQGAIYLQNGEPSGAAALLVSFVQNQGDGWTYTLDALDRYFERVLAARAEFTEPVARDLVGGVYAERAKQLGQIVAQLHRELTSVEDRPEFASEPLGTLNQRSLYQAMRNATGRVLRTLRRQAGQLPPELQAEATELTSRSSEILGVFAPLIGQRFHAAKVRVHGDLHLGQLLNTGKDFVMIDFEGEARRAVGERSLKRSALVDVASLLRSFDYVASAALRRLREADPAVLQPWADYWAEVIGQAFLTSYLAHSQGATYLPSDPVEFQTLLSIFILEKALDELEYELNYRRDFVAIPLRAVRRLLLKPASGVV